MKAPFFLSLLLFCSSVFALAGAIVGSSADVATRTSQGTVLMGGGSDVGKAFQWMIQRSGGGDFVVIRWGSLGTYNAWINGLGTVNSVETIQFDSREEAFDSVNIKKVRNAEALWIAGGDQGDYVGGWKDTPIEDAINYLINVKKVPVGGTSAGCAIMTPIYWGATTGSWPDETSAASALTNPFQSGRNGMGFNDFVTPPFLQNTIGDQHYLKRTRQPRHVAMMAYALSKGYSPIKGIGCNEATAVCIDSVGRAIVFGLTDSSYAFFINQYCGGPEVYQSGQPLTWLGGFKVYKVLGNSQGNQFMNLGDWKTVDGGGTWEYWTVNQGALTVRASAPMVCSTSASRKGAVSVRHGSGLTVTVASTGIRIRVQKASGSPNAIVSFVNVSGRTITNSR